MGDNYVPITCTISSESGANCDKVTWQFSDRNQVIDLDVAQKDEKYDIVKAECKQVSGRDFHLSFSCPYHEMVACSLRISL